MVESAEEIKRLAILMANKDGQAFDSLDEVMQNAYLHNAEVDFNRRQAIAEAQARAEEEARVAHKAPTIPADQCPACGGKGYIEINAGLTQVACGDCSGTGKVHHAEVTAPEAPGREPEAPEKPAKVKPEAIPAGQFWCTKCLALHRHTSQKGTRHSQYQDV